ncbi:MAG: branched-chain amino acid ABC transporter permease [Bacteroidetes bacterium]|nr:branched-chain amino acid ABC transporter permease [Bacteroidota bacterium]
MASLSFRCIYYPFKFVDFSIAIYITLSGYILYFFKIQLSLPLLLSITMSIVLTTLFGIAHERIILEKLRSLKSTSLNKLIISLSIYIIAQNIISLIWGDDTKKIRSIEINVGHKIMGAHITDVQILIIMFCVCISILLFIFMNQTELGRYVKAITSNEVLFSIQGINLSKVYFYSYVMGSLLSAITGILYSMESDLKPTLGFDIFILGLIALIIGGIGNYKSIMSGALLVAISQHLTAYYLDSKWMNAITYIILIAFLIWRPLGFSGQRLKKIEI